MNTQQTRALRKCAQGLKEIINAADGGQPYTVDELINEFAPLLGELYASGVFLEGEG